VMVITDAATVLAVSSWALRPPPNNWANAAPQTTSRAVAIMLGSLSANRLCGASSVASRASNGVNTG
jgi:hypothetical protein